MAPELVRLALPVIRADFKALETYRPQPWTFGDIYERIPDQLSSEHSVHCSLTVLGGCADFFVSAESCLDWYQFVIGGPNSHLGVDTIYKPEQTDGNTTEYFPRGATLPQFRLFIDKDGGHFGIFDKTNGGGEWTYQILKNTCECYMLCE